MATLCNRAGHYIIALWFLSSFFRRLISVATDWMSNVLFCPWWPWPLTLTFRLVWARDQTPLLCEFGTNPFSGSRDISCTNKKTTDWWCQKHNHSQLTACCKEGKPAGAGWPGKRPLNGSCLWLFFGRWTWTCLLVACVGSWHGRADDDVEPQWPMDVDGRPQRLCEILAE